MNMQPPSLVELFRSNTVAEIVSIGRRQQLHKELDEKTVHKLGAAAIRSVSLQRSITAAQLVDEINQDRVTKNLSPLFVEEFGGSQMHTCWTTCKLCGEVASNGGDDDDEHEWEDVLLDCNPPYNKKTKMSRLLPLSGYINGRYVVASTNLRFKEPLTKTGPGRYQSRRHLPERPQRRSTHASRASGHISMSTRSVVKAMNDRFRIQKRRPISAKVRGSVRSSAATRSNAIRQRRGAISLPATNYDGDVSAKLERLGLK